MSWRFPNPFTTGICLLAALMLCQPAVADTTNCYPDSSEGHTGSVYGPTAQTSQIIAWRTPSGGGYDHEVGYARFNLSPIPGNVMILRVTLTYYINASSGHARYKITPLELDPLVTSDFWVRWDISADASQRHPYASSSSDSIGWHRVDLGTDGIGALRTGLESGWFGVGFHNYESGIQVDGWDQANTPYLVVEHRPGPLTYHVDDDAPFDPKAGDPTVSDPLEDGSEAHPYDSIQEAIDETYWDGGSVTETVMVADGLYSGDGNRDITFGGNAIHLRSANGPENCIIDCRGSEAEPHRGFYFQTEGPYAVLEGFTITGGYATHGGAVYCGNLYGLHHSAPVIRGNVITGNTASSSTEAYGGGIYSARSSSPFITGNTITGNMAAGSPGSGGGVYCGAGAVTDNLITGNQALGSSGRGGGIYATGNVSNNIVTGNHAEDMGGGIYINTFCNCAVLSNNVVSNNTARSAAGVANAHILANCTVTGNVASNNAGGFAAGDDSIITDCIIEGNEAPIGNEIAFGGDPHHVSYSNIDRDTNDIYEAAGAAVTWGSGMLDEDPSFSSGADGDFYLDQIAAGQIADSPCLDAGSVPADQVLIPLVWSITDGTTSWTALSGRTTATNFDEDAGTVDIGFHYPVRSTVTSRLGATPTAGILPFGTQITTTLENNYTGQSRRVGARIDVTTAAGGFFSNWRAGWTNIDAGSDYTASWVQSIPALPSLRGQNTFTLRAWDVTPAPYNQPPYPESGDSDSDTRVITGIAP